MLHFLLIAISPAIIYVTARLRYSYDSHLSQHSLYVRTPDWLWIPEKIERFELGIVGSAAGMYAFILYNFIFMLIVAIHSQGWFLSKDMRTPITLNRVLLSSHLITGLLLLSGALYMLYTFSSKFIYFIIHQSFDAGLLNSWNLSRFIFDFLGFALFLGYACWVLADDIHLWKARNRQQAVA